MGSLGEATEVSATEGGFTATLDPEWTVNGRPHGGYLLALMGRAAVAAVGAGDHPHPLSASAVYLTSPVVGPATITVEVLRRGRTASHARARLAQEGQAKVEALFILGRLDPGTEPHWADAPPVEVADFHACTRSSTEPPGTGVRVAMLDRVDQRLDPAYLRPGLADLRGWIAFADGTAFDPNSLLYAVDGFPPATIPLGSVGWVPTLELTTYIRGVPAPGPLRVRQHVRLVTDGRVDQLCDIWDSRGRLVAQASQLAAARMG